MMTKFKKNNENKPVIPVKLHKIVESIRNIVPFTARFM